MKKIFKRFLYIASMFCLLVACDNEEFFELTNPVADPWLNIDELENAPIGAYYALTGNAGERAIFTHARMAGEAFADGINLGPIASGFEVQPDVEDMYNRATAGSQIDLFDDGVFRSGYFAVGFANGALDFITANEGNPFPEVGPEPVRRIEGELRFIRAFAYYWLARIYLPVYPNDSKLIPFRTSQAQDFDEAIVSELASANDIYDFIVNDLVEAKQLLPERYDPELHPVAYADGRANRFAAAALLAKVYFHMGRYDEAAAEADFVIEQNGGDYDLSEDPIEAFNKTGVNRGQEVLWYYALWAGDGLGGGRNWKHPFKFGWYNAVNSQAGNPSNNEDRFMIASDAFLQQAGWMDANLNETPEALMDKRYTQLFVRFEASSSAISPEPRSGFSTTRPYVWNNRYYQAGDRITNLPVLRLADMYLLRAIVRANLGSAIDLGGARDDLNIVRNRAGIGDFLGTDVELVNAIHMERFKEMAFEGDRLYYLQANRMDIPAGDRGGATVPWDSPFFSDVPDFEIEINEGYRQ